jgi:low temperature requirement protein LtrA
VFTLTQLSATLQHDLTPAGAGRVLLVFVVLFWMYGGYVWLTNQVPPRNAARRVLLICGMAGFFICALSIPRAFDEDGLAFGVGYAIVVLVHAGLYAEAYGPAVVRFVPTNVLGAASVLGAALVDVPLRYALWLLPIALQYLASALTRRVDAQTRTGFDVRPGHFVERHGLLLIVAFGESIVAIGIGIAGEPVNLATAGPAVLGLVLTAALWWTYFGADERQGERVLSTTTLEGRVVKALNAYFYAFIPILLGIVTVAAGLRLVIGHIGATLQLGPALLLGGGVALYLVGDVGYRVALHIRPIVVRLAGAVLALASIAFGIGISALAQLVALVAILLGMLLIEARSDWFSHDARAT